MAKLQPQWQQIVTWLRKRWQALQHYPYMTVIIVVGTLLAFIIIVGYSSHLGWIGLSGPDTQIAKITTIPGGAQAQVTSPMKTFWDWMQLLIVPIVLAGGGYIFSSVTKRNAEEIAANNRQEETLRSYFGTMSDLLLKNDVLNQKSEQVRRDLVRAHTLNILRMVDAERKGYVLQFLSEAGLINMLTGTESTLRRANLRGAKLDNIELPKAWLHEIDFSGADLSFANLSGAQLQGSIFIRANLSGCQLQGAYLNSAKLMKADLRGADLSGAQLDYSEPLKNPETADLSGANLSMSPSVPNQPTKLCNAHLVGATLEEVNLTGADLTGADLSGANLTGANLREAILNGVDLSGAILTKAKITAEQLKTVKSYEGVTMPNERGK